MNLIQYQLLSEGFRTSLCELQDTGIFRVHDIGGNGGHQERSLIPEWEEHKAHATHNKGLLLEGQCCSPFKHNVPHDCQHRDDEQASDHHAVGNGINYQLLFQYISSDITHRCGLLADWCCHLFIPYNWLEGSTFIRRLMFRFAVVSFLGLFDFCSIEQLREFCNWIFHILSPYLRYYIVIKEKVNKFYLE